MKTGIAIVVILLIGGVIAAVTVSQIRRDNAEREAARLRVLRELDEATAPSTQPVAQAPIVETPAAEKPAEVATTPTTTPAQAPSQVAIASSPVSPAPNKQATQNPQQRTRKAGAPAQPAQPAVDPGKPIARQALALVGTDPIAEQVWINTINDPNTSEHDRSDLIEDLNEEGFDDPHNITMDDLPLIENRLALIEQLGPIAMDDVNAAAFAEAYKDLVNMHVRLMGR